MSEKPSIREYVLTFQYQQEGHNLHLETFTRRVTAYDAADAITQAKLRFGSGYPPSVLLNVAPALESGAK